MPSSTSYRGLAAASLVLAATAAPAGAAIPAPAGTAYAINPAGQPGHLNDAVAVSQDGYEVLFSDLPTNSSLETELFARNLRTNTTTRVLPVGDVPLAASANNQRVLFRTTRTLDSNDRNATADWYVLDRVTGVASLVSKLASGLGAGAPGTAAISGDGNVVVYDTTKNGSPWVLRYALATGAVSIVGPGSLLNVEGHLDTTGSAVITSAGLVANGKTIPIPFDPATGYGTPRRHFLFSPDGSTMLEDRRSRKPTEVILTNTSTGVQQSVASYPDAGPGGPAVTLGVANGGTSVLVARSVLDASGADRDEIDRITPAGVSTPIALAPSYSVRGQIVLLSADGAYVAGTKLFKIGTSTGSGPVPTPIPAALTPVTPAASYVAFYPGCEAGGFFAPLVRPSVVLSRAAVGPSTRVPASASVVVTPDATGDESTPVTVNAGARLNLAAGWGGYWLSATIKFTDGTSALSYRHIATYTPITNDTSPFGGASSCKTVNGL